MLGDGSTRRERMGLGLLAALALGSCRAGPAEDSLFNISPPPIA
jgi:hypothetical protein